MKTTLPITCFLIFTLVIAGISFGESDEAKVKESFVNTIEKELESLSVWGAKSKAHPENSIKYWDSDREWHAFYTEYVNYSYDIQKTNSIISPYIGIVTFEGKTYEKVGTTKKDGLNSEWKEIHESDPTLKYAYQDGTWILKEAPWAYKRNE
jgi:protein involved in polysaccharide export with SLBB domain